MKLTYIAHFALVSVLALARHFSDAGSELPGVSSQR